LESTEKLEPKKAAGFKDYLAIARLDHSTKHVFIIPGIILAHVLRKVPTEHFILSLILGFATAIFIASANYVINEFLDREFDQYHPSKSKRSAVRLQMNGKIVIVEWALFVTAGLACAILSNKLMFLIACLFMLQGIVYNVNPMRTKDRAYLDVISESINNPIRLIIGWAIVDPTSLPPGSLILSFWFGGAFLMAAKRVSEYRQIAASHGADLLARYRASFANYSEVSLISSCMGYSLFSVSFLAIFIIKYRIEYLIAIPFVIILFTTYFSMSTLAGSSAQKPEKLFRETGLIALVLLVVAVIISTSFLDIPLLESLAGQHFIDIK
jgi:4-hydroxybenzoate polyprenyltransferase